MTSKSRTNWARLAVFALSMGSGWAGSGNAPAIAQDKQPASEQVVVGTRTVHAKTPNAMTVTLKVGPARDMHMPHAGVWVKMGPLPGEQFHFEVDLMDPASGHAIFHSRIRLRAINVDSKKGVNFELHPMWGSEGLHYGANTFIPGDGQYTLQLTVESPTFAREAPAFQFMWEGQIEFVIQVQGARVIPQ